MSSLCWTEVAVRVGVPSKHKRPAFCLAGYLIPWMKISRIPNLLRASDMNHLS